MFHTRCPRRLSTGICESTEPPLLEEEPGHLIRCHIPITELRISNSMNPPHPREALYDHGKSITADSGSLRQGQGEIANHIIDEFAAGRLSRRDFIRRASVVGISASALGPILAACSSSGSSSARPASSASASGNPAR